MINSLIGNNQLIGIILVANSNLRGDKLVFRYPQVQRSGLSLETKYAIKGKMFGDTGGVGQDFMWKEPPTDVNEPPILNLYATRYAAYHMPSVVLCPLLCPKSCLKDGAPFELILDRTMFIGQAVVPKLTTRLREVQAQTSDRENDVITMYNFYLVIDRDSDPEFIRMIKYIVQQIATASLYEENRSSYITQQISKMFAIREEWLLKIQKENITIEHHNLLTKNLYESSSLADTMRNIFHGLKQKGKKSCLLNDWLKLDLSLKNIFEYPNLPLRPYQTILLLKKSTKILASLPLDASPSLRLVVQMAKPIKNFTHLQQETGIPLSQLYRIASHLVYWGKAKIIFLPTKLNIYTLNPNPTDNYHQLLVTKFRKEFNSLYDLSEILESFSVPTKLGDHLLQLSASQQQHQTYVNVIAWLIRHDLLIQIHTYLYLIISTKKIIRKANKIAEKKVKTDSTLTFSPTAVSGALMNSVMDRKKLISSTPEIYKSVFNEPHYVYEEKKDDAKILEKVNSSPNSNLNQLFPLSPVPLTEEEETFINSLNDGSPTFQQFKQICPYLRGKHHIEEIMWRENIARDEINVIIEKYRYLLLILNY